jgi:tol-pal system protein YbgF
MMKAALTSFAIAALLAGSSPAQTITTPSRGAPITKGVTTGDLSVQVDQAREQAADLLVQVNRLQDQLTRINGRVEALEFELGRAREANNDLLSDNETLARDADRMREALAAQARAIAGLQVLLGVEPEPEAEAYSDAGNDPQASAGAAATAQAAFSDRGTALSSPAQISENGSLPEGSLGTLPASDLPGDAGALFAEAKNRLIRLDYPGAEEAFQSFIRQFSTDKQAGEAHFWLGEALHQQQAYAESGAAYTTMIRSYPDDVRAPDALVRLARAMRLLGETGKACTALETLPKRYPDATKVVRDLAAVERTRSGCDS